MITIRLTETEFVKCIDCAKKFRKDVEKNNRRQPGYVATAIEDYDSALNGVMSELAASKWFGIEYKYDFTYDRDRPDLINGVEVKSTRVITGHLIVESVDKFAPQILAIVHFDSNVVVLRGWRDLTDCLQQKYYREPPEVRQASYWVPQIDLCDMQSLKTKLAS